MTYSIALRVFAVLLVLLSIGMMSFVAQYARARQPEAPRPGPVRYPERAPVWPDATLRIGTVALLVSFVVLTGACLLIADV
ncbi:MAG TPA: hypothetical protein VIH96_05645 [Paraburkholderia sp.]|jgi:hypothetical protein